MAELIPRERLQPSLLDRLTDDEPARRQESLQERVLTMRQLRRSVLRDLAWLLNTGNLTAVNDLSRHAFAARSVVNYGVPDLTGRLVAGMTPKSLEGLIRQAIIDFEPRILPHTVRVRTVVTPEQMDRNAVSFEIEGDLWGQPVPVRLLVQTEIDIETGHIAMRDNVIAD
jgi:type VI secretion system protein ImpF